MTTLTCPLETPIGPIGVTTEAGRLREISFLDRLPSRRRHPRDASEREILVAIERYFTDPSTPLDLPLTLEGTPFQQRVWRTLQAIPPGRVRSYGDIARELGSGARAVGNACRRNPIPLVVPCHRVVSASGIGGFSGATQGGWLEKKRWLLAHEGVVF